MLCVQTSDDGYNLNSAGFDNVGMAAITVFQIITMCGWEFIMYRSVDNTSPASIIYYLILIFLVGYIVVSNTINTVLHVSMKP